MAAKIIGAILILLVCGGVGFYLATAHKKEINLIKELIGAIDYMCCELQYRMPALPDLCRQTAYECNGILRDLFTKLAVLLENRTTSDVRSAMSVLLSDCKTIPQSVRDALVQLGNNLGRFDLDSQIKGLEYMRTECRSRLNSLQQNADGRIRNYQTLGLCGGAALVILLL